MEPNLLSIAKPSQPGCCPVSSVSDSDLNMVFLNQQNKTTAYRKNHKSKAIEALTGTQLTSWSPTNSF